MDTLMAFNYEHWRYLTALDLTNNCAARQTGCWKSVSGYVHCLGIESSSGANVSQNPNENGIIKRTDHIPDTVPRISRFQQSVLHQGRIEQYFIDFISQRSNIRVERSVAPMELSWDTT